MIDWILARERDCESSNDCCAISYLTLKLAEYRIEFFCSINSTSQNKKKKRRTNDFSTIVNMLIACSTRTRVRRATNNVLAHVNQDENHNEKDKKKTRRRDTMNEFLKCSLVVVVFFLRMSLFASASSMIICFSLLNQIRNIYCSDYSMERRELNSNARTHGQRRIENGTTRLPIKIKFQI